MKSKPEILHICPDEKYIDGAIYLFEKAIHSNNEFLIISAYRGEACLYVKSKSANIKKWQRHQNVVEDLLKVVGNYKVVLLHGLTAITSELVIRSGGSPKYLWIIMGAEVYENSLIYKAGLFGERTLTLMEESTKKIDFLEILKKYYTKFWVGDYREDKNYHANIIKAMSKVSGFVALVREEFEFLTENSFLPPGTKHQLFTYYPIEYFSGLAKNSICTEGNILIGNSSNYSNNHLEVFEKLKRLNISGRSIITPLSYGNMNYKKVLIPYGRAIFGKQFKPIIDFLPLEEYNNLLSSCGIVIMNHYRQQAVGNILMALWQGSKVYLSDLNILYKFFLRIGCRVFSVEKELVPENKEVLQLLDADTIEQNRKALKDHISEKVLVDKLRQGFKENYNIG